MIDVLFISPGNASEIYQGLATDYSAIEPPTWALLLAESCRSVGYKVGLIDVLAEKLLHKEVIDRINQLQPRLVCIVAMGQNVNAGAVTMSGAVKLANDIKAAKIETPIGLVGSYPQALPYKTLEDEPSIDIVFCNEGVYVFRNLLNENGDKFVDLNKLDHVNGIGYRKDGKPFLNPPEGIVPQNRMDEDLPGYAWDLLPKKENPFDLYRCPMWHSNYDQNKRSPYATVYTSLGCIWTCDFCMINILNRTSNDPIGVASKYNVMRHWSTERVVKQIDKLVEMGVYTIRICDEMFLLNKKYYLPICEELSKKPYADKLLMWAYSRVDTVAKNPKILELLRKAGFKWLCLGIESGNRNVRLEASKGKFEDVDIKEVVNSIHDAGIEVLANYLFGLPEDTMETMQQTLDLSLELCTSGWNGYCTMAFPGSQLYKDALQLNYDMPKTYSAWSYHSYDMVPMRTKYLTAAEVVKFRDEAFTTYHTYPPFLKRIEEKFGKQEVENIVKMTQIKLKRKILGD
ncbi:radical SAM protein [Candidatus Parcubacteria bacterium]|nr:MAG: radical SAM protein [Candidatus Parcubacteria bacterium]